MGWTEWLIIVAVAVLLFRPRQFGRAAGDIAGQFKTDANVHDESATTERTQHLAVLELPPDATPEQIRRAWRELAKVWHPDRFARDAALQAKATAKLAAINAAYEALNRTTAG